MHNKGYAAISLFHLLPLKTGSGIIWLNAEGSLSYAGITGAAKITMKEMPISPH